MYCVVIVNLILNTVGMVHALVIYIFVKSYLNVLVSSSISLNLVIYTFLVTIHAVVFRQEFTLAFFPHCNACVILGIINILQRCHILIAFLIFNGSIFCFKLANIISTSATKSKFLI